MRKYKARIYLFIFFVAITLAAIFFGHYFLFSSLIRFLAISNSFYVGLLKLALILLSLSFIAASVLIHRFANFWTRAYYTVSAVWLGLLLYLFLACLLVYLILFLANFFHFSVNTKILTVTFLTAAVAIVIYGIFSAQNIRIKKLDITLPGLPASWRNKTAVWVSDLHLGVIDNYDFAERVAKQIDGLRPDLLFIGGDFYDGQANVDLDRLAGYFSTLNVPQGKYFVTGNHEEFGNNAKFLAAIKKANIRFLNDELINLDGLQIIGVDYKFAYDKDALDAILENLKINKNQPSILLKHVPDKIEVAAKYGVSLMLSGHAHRGQLFPTQIIEYFLYGGFQYGLKKMGATLVYTSSGVGTWGPPLRVLANPEIVQISFK